MAYESVGGVNINNLRYADDTTLIVDSETKLQNLLNSVVRENELNSLTLNKKVCLHGVLKIDSTTVL